jgi:hypothetical protein
MSHRHRADVSIRHDWGRAKELPDELSSRRPSFRPGRQIRLADGQFWMFPAPPQSSEWRVLPFDRQYVDILQAISESEDHAEQSLGELAFTIFLLGHNYLLTPADYERLLGSAVASPVAGDWKHALGHCAQEHLRSYLDAFPDSVADRPAQSTERAASRLIMWLRDRLPPRWFSVESRGL